MEKLEIEIKKMLNLDSVKYLKNDDVAKYFRGIKNGQQIDVKYLNGKIFTKNKNNWNIVNGIFIKE